MNTEDLSDGEWREILDEFRLLVVRAGYTDWDATTMDALADEFDERDGERGDRASVAPPIAQLRRYAQAFMRYLKARSRYARSERLAQLSHLLHTDTGAPVEDFVVDFEGRERPIFGGKDDPDGMIDSLSRFIVELSGEDGSFFDDDEDGIEDDM